MTTTISIKRIGLDERLATWTWKACVGKISIFPRANIYLCFSLMLLQVFISDSPVAGEVNVVGAYVYVWVFIGRATRQGKYLKFSEPYTIASSWTSTSNREMIFGSDVSIATERELIGTIFHSALKVPQVHWSIHDVPKMGPPHGSQHYQTMHGRSGLPYIRVGTWGIIRGLHSWWQSSMAVRLQA